MDRADRILWIDWIGAAVVGVATISLRDWLSEVGGLPRDVLLTVGLANLAYAAFSLSLSLRPTRSMRLIGILVGANLAWSVVCLGLLLGHWSTVNALAVLHLGGEALYVGVLAMLEWRGRERLARVDSGRKPRSGGFRCSPER